MASRKLPCAHVRDGDLKKGGAGNHELDLIDSLIGS